MYARDNAATAAMQQQPPTGAQVEAAVTALRMLADPTRLRLLWLLDTSEYDVSSLAAAVGTARPSVSQHLAKLRLAGLVTVRREGRRAVYATRGKRVHQLLIEVLGTTDASAHAQEN